MCGRYTLTTPQEELLAFLDHPAGEPVHEPRYNIAPTQLAPALVLGRQGPRIGLLRWGLIPFWTSRSSGGAGFINARSESVADRPAFREPFRRRRCLILADGFYEWKREGGRRAPHWIHLPSREPFAFAGIWDRWMSEGEEPIYSFAILTTEASPSLRSIHDRMPVILSRAAHEIWLRRESSHSDLVELLRPYPDTVLEAWEVSTRVNSPENDDPSVLDPVG
jgi:putative SOS response-associated peptidase YedK